VEHVRIARVLLIRHGRAEGERRVLEGTLRNCEAAGVPDRFDESLTRAWVEAIANALEQADGATFGEFIELHPALGRSDSIARG
jgi:hypothetical protein